jgi:hypothetical protein
MLQLFGTKSTYNTTVDSYKANLKNRKLLYIANSLQWRGVSLTQYYLGDHNKQDEMKGHVERMDENCTQTL